MVVGSITGICFRVCIWRWGLIFFFWFYIILERLSLFSTFIKGCIVFSCYFSCSPSYFFHVTFLFLSFHTCFDNVLREYFLLNDGFCEKLLFLMTSYFNIFSGLCSHHVDTLILVLINNNLAVLFFRGKCISALSSSDWA